MFDGRGRWYRWSKKPTVGEYLCLDVGAFARDCDLERRGSGIATITWGKDKEATMGITIMPGEGVLLSYSVGGEPVAPYIVPIAYTTPNFGGRRPWFLCPHCRRRVRYLYGGRLFLCRECHGLTYAIRQERGAKAVTTAARNRRQHVAARLGAKLGGWLEHSPTPTKPPYLHWRTYLRLLIEYRKLEEVEDIAFYAALGSGLVEFSLPAALHPRRLWTEAKAQRRNPNDHASAVVGLAAAARRRVRPRSAPLKLSELATRAGVSAELAREAVRARLLRPDVGRGTRQTRYRARLVNWLRKLAQLRAAGQTWAEIRAWTRRRWLPGHDQERTWPAGHSERR